MRPSGVWAAVLTFFLAALRIAAQSGPVVAAPEFDAVSLKLAGSPDGGAAKLTGGPGTADPGRIAWSNVTLAGLVAKAYGLSGDQVFGPAWIASEAYSLNATLALDTTQEQFQLMLQRLLSERFNLRVHHEMHEFSGYQLTVGKKGPNLKNLKLAPDAPDADPAEGDNVDGPPVPAKGLYSDDPDGCPKFSTPGFHMGGTPGIRGCLGYQNTSMAELCRNLALLIKMRDGIKGQEARLLDRTGLTGQYDFRLKLSLIPYAMRTWTIMQQTGGPDENPPLEVALEQQLGLKLESIKEPLDAVFVDQASRTPSEN